MKTVIAGSREIRDIQVVLVAIEESGFQITEVVSGTARGVDQIGEAWATRRGIPIRKFYPVWRDRDGWYNPGAGMQRNADMAKYADAAVIIWDGESTGTANMIAQAKRHGLKLYVHRTDIEEGLI